jgi:hypothetical protein
LKQVLEVLRNCSQRPLFLGFPDRFDRGGGGVFSGRKQVKSVAAHYHRFGSMNSMVFLPQKVSGYAYEADDD